MSPTRSSRSLLVGFSSRQSPMSEPSELLIPV